MNVEKALTAIANLLSCLSRKHAGTYTYTSKEEDVRGPVMGRRRGVTGGERHN